MTGDERGLVVTVMCVSALVYVLVDERLTGLRRRGRAERRFRRRLRRTRTVADLAEPDRPDG